MIFYNYQGNLIEDRIEGKERELAAKTIKKYDCVLELGARFGCVSCVINKKLENKQDHVAVEPDERVFEALERNRDNNNCEFKILKGIISNKKQKLTNLEAFMGGYAANTIESEDGDLPLYSIQDAQDLCSKPFNVLFVDCEGCLESFLRENLDFVKQLRLVVFEQDRPDHCNYRFIRNLLTEEGFKRIKAPLPNCVFEK